MLQAYGIAVPQAILADSDEEAGLATEKFGGRAMVKGQVLTGGRGKAGAIRAVSSKDEARNATRDILGMSVKGFPVKCVLVTERIDIQGEYYLGITIDRTEKSVVLILSAAGGMDIEQIAAEHPEQIRRLTLHGTRDEIVGPLRNWLAKSFSNPGLCDQATDIVINAYRLLREKDGSLVEINPLALTGQDRLIAADAKVVIDENALPRHADLEALRNPEEYTESEREAKAAGLSFVSLTGEIGCMVNGAGLAMATMDGLKLAGGSPANFLDVGGSSNPQKVLDAMRILLKNEELKVILVNIFGGITRCDDVARGIVAARDQLNISVPMVIRLIGTNEEEGRAILEQAGLIVASRMTDAIHDAVRCARGEGQA